jgi:hypothetical protein
MQGQSGAVAVAKAITPRPNTSKLSTLRKLSALIKQPTDITTRIVRIFIKALAAVSAQRQINQKNTKANRYQEQRLKFVFDTQVEKGTADENH